MSSHKSEGAADIGRDRSRRWPLCFAYMSTKKSRARAGSVLIKVDAKLKKAYDTLVTVIAAASRQEAVDFDQRWEAAAAIVDHDPPLYVMGGYKNADAFYREVMHEEPRVARRCTRVAKYASPEEEQRHGVSKLDAALGFIESKLGRALVHPPLPVAFERLRIPVGKTTKRLEEATVAEINAATSKLTASWRKRPQTLAQSSLAASLARVESLRSVTVHERRGLVTFQNVPLAAMGRFASALGRAKLGDPSKTRKRSAR